MRILYISDLHASYNPDLAAATLEHIYDKTSPDIILHGGDFESLEYENVRNTLFRIMEKTPFYTILGNHDNVEEWKSLKNEDGTPVLIDTMTSKGVLTIDGLNIAGIGGLISSRSIQSRTKYSYEEYKEKILSLRLFNIDILMTHMPLPKTSHPESIDFMIINYAVNFLKPKIHLCGHVHDRSYHITTIGDTISIRAITHLPWGGYAIIEMKNGQVKDITVGRIM